MATLGDRQYQTLRKIGTRLVPSEDVEKAKLGISTHEDYATAVVGSDGTPLMAASQPFTEGLLGELRRTNKLLEIIASILASTNVEIGLSDV